MQPRENSQFSSEVKTRIRHTKSTEKTGISNWSEIENAKRNPLLFDSAGLKFTSYEFIFILIYKKANCVTIISSKEWDKNKIPFLPGRAGILSRTGGAMASEMLTVTTVTKLVGVSRATEHMKESSASQTTGLSGAAFPSFTSVLSFWDLWNIYNKYFSQSVFSVDAQG